MSQYITFSLKKRPYLKKIGILPDEIECGWLCTTPARTISSEGIFRYTEDDTLVPKGDFERMKEFVKSEAKVYHSVKEDLRSVEFMLCSAKTQYAASELMERRDQLIVSKNETLEYYNSVRGWYKVIRSAYIKSFILGLFYRLYYTNC